MVFQELLWCFRCLLCGVFGFAVLWGLLSCTGFDVVFWRFYVVFVDLLVCFKMCCDVCGFVGVS